MPNTVYEIIAAYWQATLHILTVTVYFPTPGALISEGQGTCKPSDSQT